MNNEQFPRNLVMTPWTKRRQVGQPHLDGIDLRLIKPIVNAKYTQRVVCRIFCERWPRNKLLILPRKREHGLGAQVQLHSERHREKEVRLGKKQPGWLTPRRVVQRFQRAAQSGLLDLMAEHQVDDLVGVVTVQQLHQSLKTEENVRIKLSSPLTKSALDASGLV